MGLISRVSSRTYRCMSSSHFSKKYEKPTTTTTKHKELVSDIYNTLIDIEILGVVFERHRKHKTEPILPITTTTTSSSSTKTAATNSSTDTSTTTSSSITTTTTATQSPPLPD